MQLRRPRSAKTRRLRSEKAKPSAYPLAAGTFGIGMTEFVIMGLLQQVSVSIAGQLASGQELGVFVGAPVLPRVSRRLLRKTVLMPFMVIFTLGNVACARTPSHGLLMKAQVLTALANGNLRGGQLADRGLSAALIYILSTLAAVLGLMTVEIDSQLPAVIFMGLFGTAAFATVAPLQPRVLAQASGVGQNPASSLNLAAFNLGSALGA